MTIRIIHLFALFFILIALFLPTTVSAQTSPVPANVSPTSPIYTDLLVHNLFHSFSCLAIGSSVIGQPCLNYIQGVPVLSSVNTTGGVLGTTGNLIGLLYTNPPVRTIDYLASVGQGLGIVKEAQAQVVGSGAQVLNPILTLWQVSRNISYVIMIIIFVIIGLMVMFRTRINPQTVITAQAALPGLIIGLILITFSYFLAALISDAAFIGTNMVGYYFGAAQGNPPQDLVADISDKSIITLFSRFAGIIGKDDGAYAINVIFNNANDNVQRFLRFAAGVFAFQVGSQIGHATPIVGDVVGPIVGLIGSLATAALPGEMLGQLVSWAAIAVLIVTMLKLLLRLINNYLSIIFLTVTAPFQFMAAALPGRQEIATAWIMNMLCNVLAFPAVAAVLYFVAYLLGPNNPNLASTAIAPFNVTSQTGLIGGNTLPLLGGLDTKFINLLLAFGALVALPAIPDIICRTVGRVGVAGQLIGQELGANVGTGRGYFDQTQQRFFGAGRKLGQDFDTLRGVMPGQAPAGRIFIGGKKLADIEILGRKPFGKKM